MELTRVGRIENHVTIRPLVISDGEKVVFVSNLEDKNDPIGTSISIKNGQIE